MITSRSNPKIKQARALRQRKEREATGLFLVEGIAHVTAALDSGAALDCLLHAPGLLTSPFARAAVANASARGIACLAVSAEVFESISDKDNPSGLLAIARKPVSSLEALNPTPPAWYVALVAPQDPGNLGAIVRTLDAVGASGLILLDGGADPYHPNAVRASLGALFYKPVVSTRFKTFVDWAKQNRQQVIGTSAKAETHYRAAHYEQPLVLLMGSEQKGLTPEQRSACDQLIRLPMEGKVSSLNLAVAAGVLLYEIKARSNQI